MEFFTLENGKVKVDDTCFWQIVDRIRDYYKEIYETYKRACELHDRILHKVRETVALDEEINLWGK